MSASEEQARADRREQSKQAEPKQNAEHILNSAADGRSGEVPNPVPATFRIVDHVADLAIEVQAESLEQLFRNALSGMTSLILPAEDRETEGLADTDVEKEHKKIRLRLDLEAPDADVLLVDMLNRINLESSLEGIAFETLEIELLNSKKMQGFACGYVTATAFEIDIKAVTYHGLRIEKDPNGRFLAQILFDI